jgi:hypothetical protein
MRGRTDRLDLLLRQLGGGEAAAAFQEALELLILVGADEVAGDLAVARDGDGLALGPHPVSAEIAGELGSRGGLGGVHGSSPSGIQYTLTMAAATLLSPSVSFRQAALAGSKGMAFSGFGADTPQAALAPGCNTA